MKLNVNYKTIKKKVDVADNISYDELINEVKFSVGATGQFLLSLTANAQNVFSADYKTNIKSLGLVSGDQVYLIEDSMMNELYEMFCMKDYSTFKKFEELLNDHGCLESVDFLFLVTHGIMMKHGFHVKRSSDMNLLEELPSNWKNGGGFFKIQYRYEGSNDTVECSGSKSGKFLTVTGVLIPEKLPARKKKNGDTMDTDDSDSGDNSDDDMDNEPYQLRLRVPDYVNSKITIYEPKYIYKNINDLQNKIGIEFAAKLKNDVEERMSKASLSKLSESLLIHIFQYLDAGDVAVCSRLSKRFNKVCKQEQIWENILFKELELKKRSYKEAVKKLYDYRKDQKLRQEKEKKAFIEQQEIALRKAQQSKKNSDDFAPQHPRFQAPPEGFPTRGVPFHGGYPDEPNPYRGIVGGARDLFPPNPFQPNGGDFRMFSAGRPFGYRYDPIGPLPEDEFRMSAGRSLHRDLMRRPGFDYFDSDGFI